MKRNCVSILILGLSLSASVWAAPLPSYDMEEIVIVATQEAEAVNSDKVNKKYITPGKSVSVPELLRSSTGIDIHKRTAYGDNTDNTVRVRGFDARRYTVLLDGRQINAAGVMGGQYVDWNSIPLDTIERIQIIKGGKLAEHGNTLGGTINIITKKNAVGGSTTLLAGSQGRREYRLHYGFNAGKLNMQLMANTGKAEAFLRNNDADSYQYGVRFNYAPDENNTLRFGYQKTHMKRGFIVPNKRGSYNYDPIFPESKGDDVLPALTGAVLGDGSYWKKDNDYFDFSYKRSHKKGYWQFDYYRNNEERNDVISNMGTLLVDRVVPSDKSDYFGFKGKEEIGVKHTLGYGVEYKRLRYGYGHYNYLNPSITYSSIVPSQKIDLWGFYIDDEWRIDKRWNGYLGLRYDKFMGMKDDAAASTMRDYATDSLSPKISFSFKNDSKTTTYYSINRVWRAPSMAEYYWWSNLYNNPNLFNGQPNPTYHKQLQPEKGMSYEIAVAHNVNKNYQSKVGVFYEDLTNYINFRHVKPFMIYNIDKAKIWGVEWENNFCINKKSSLLVNYTNMHTQKKGVLSYDRNNGLTGGLDNSPRHKLSIGYAFNDKKWQVRYDVNYVSEQQESYDGRTYDIGGYAVHNMSVSYALSKNSTLSFYIDNIFAKEYAEQHGYPQNGRLFNVAFMQKF